MYDKVKLMEILLHPNFRTVDDSGKPYVPSSKIYYIISEEMKKFKCNISPKHIYVIINENRSGCKDEILKAFDIKARDSIASHNISSCSVETATNSMSTVLKEFCIIISSEQWKAIMPVRKLYGRNNYRYVLQSGWTDIIAEKVWQQQKLTCTLVFKKHDVHLSNLAKYYVVVRANCKECNAIITGRIMQRPRDNTDIKMHFIAENVEDNFHEYKKKRHLKGQRRKFVTDVLINEKLDAITFRRQEAKRLKDFGDVEPSIMPNAAVLRKAKEQALLEKHGFLYVNPALNLLNSAKNGKFAGAIHSIGVLEFYCIYWSPEQQLLYKIRNKKTCTGFMTIDATGGVVSKSSNCESPVFLYQCMFVDSDGSFPVFQMISADHKSMHIAYFLRKILSQGNSAPRMVVCDFGWAILIAVAEVFAKCIDLRNYMKTCYNILHGIPDKIPLCYIRLDVCHFVRMVSRWDCLKHKDKFLVRKFYIRCLSQAYQMISLQELFKFFEAVLVVALSEYVGVDENGIELPSELSLKYLNSMIKGIEAPDFSNEENENLESNDWEDSDDQNSSDWFQWSANIYDNANKLARNCTEGTAINACFNPPFASVLKTRLMPYVTLWSGVMRSHFNIGEVIATSSSVEAAFNDLKKRALKNQLPMKADKFVHEHLDYVDGRIKLSSCQNDISTESYKQQNRVEIYYASGSPTEQQVNRFIDTCEINLPVSDDIQNESVINITTNDNELNCNVRENWRGLIRESPETQCSVKKRRKPTYLDKCPEWDFIKFSRNENIPLIRNGSISKSVNIQNKIICINQTCAFDATLHLVTSGIATIKCYDDKMKISNNATVKLANSILSAGKILQSHYNERAKILLNLLLFKDALTIYTRAISKLEATCNVAHLITYLFSDLPSCSIITECLCASARTRQTVELHINVNILLNKGLQHVQEAIDDALNISSKCKKCLENVNESTEYGPHLFIDTSVFTDEGYTNRDITIAHSLQTISTEIKIKSNLYVLVGIVHYINSSYDNNVSGHYVAYARCGAHWYEHDDLKKKRHVISAKSIVKPHLLYYVKLDM